MDGQNVLFSVAPFFTNPNSHVSIRTQIDPAYFVDVTETLFRAGFSGATHERIDCDDCESGVRHEATYWIDGTETHAGITVVLWWSVPEIRPESRKVEFRNHAEEIAAALDGTHPALSVERDDEIQPR